MPVVSSEGDKSLICRIIRDLGVVRGGGEKQLKAIAAALSVLITVLMLAQPVLAGETSNKLTIPDVQGDLKKQ